MIIENQLFLYYNFGEKGMLSINDLIGLLEGHFREISVKKSEDFVFSKRDEAFLIKKGEVLSYGKRNLTQLMGQNDPIGFSETILARDHTLRYRRVSDLEILGFSGSQIRNEVNSAGVTIKSLIQYSLSRIFENKKSKSHQLFEEGFIHKNIKYLRTLKFDDGDYIFQSGSPSRFMYFIDKGSIRLLTKNEKDFKVLNTGESFGEASLFLGQERELGAVAIGETTLHAIDADRVSPEIEKDSPLVQLSLFCVLKRLELMNKLTAADG
tara:strand:- start:253 stop:1053 length:801 start_codon:yes stop_codon:yes gene_type:complete